MTTRNASPGPAMRPPTATARSPCSSCIPVASFLCGVRASPAAPGGHGLSGRPSLSAFPTVTPGLRRRISPIALRIPAPRSPARRTQTGPLIWNEATQSWDEPAEDDDWGDLHFRGAAPDAGGEWTDDGSRQELRPTITNRRAWIRAPQDLLTLDEQASPLARRPYDLRHACLSTWLNGGVAPTQVAEWAGHSVDVLLRIYAKCLAGQHELAKRRITEAHRSASQRRCSVVLARAELRLHWRGIRRR